MNPQTPFDLEAAIEQMEKEDRKEKKVQINQVKFDLNQSVCSAGVVELQLNVV
jgi:hypothetical protein